MRSTSTVGNVTAWVILSLFYIAVITVYGLIFKLLRADPLRMRSRTPGWQPLPSQYDRLEDAKRQ